MFQRVIIITVLQTLYLFTSGSSLLDFEQNQSPELNVHDRSNIEESLFSFQASRDVTPKNTTCKVFPGDAKWPSDDQWAVLNTTTTGALIKTIPLASVCYPGPLSNPDECSYITAQWTNSSIHMVDPTSPMSPLWQGRTCEPPSLAPSPNGTCTLGGLPSYSINATTVAQVQAGINFARNSGIRLVIKNTGHDFSGKSSGAGSLNIWTHYLKDIEFIPAYTEDLSYNGPTFKAGSGVQAWEIYEAAEKYGVTVVGGEGKTVGVLGGYILGGGHSPLSSIYGMAADHILSVSLVLASGEFITASPKNNTELFWALRGGGGSTFGVVTSIIIKAHPPLPVTSLSFSFGFPGNITTSQFWSGVRSYFTHFPTFVDAGTYGYFFVFPGPPSSPPIFSLSPFFAPNLTITQTQALLSPWLAELSTFGISPNITYTHYPTYLPAWQASFPQEAIGRDAGLFGSRLFPRENFLSPNSALFNSTFEAWKGSIEAGFAAISFQIRAPLHSSNSGNAVNSAWRQTVMHSIISNGWAPQGNSSSLISDEVAARKALDERMAAWKNVTPGAGAYLGESDRQEVGWQESFYGKGVYEKLLAVKRKVDTGQLFWAKTAVGSEGWDVRSANPVGDENGPLCRVDVIEDNVMLG